jgi:RNA polymerase sigma-70 factor, ECF subfamily
MGAMHPDDSPQMRRWLQQAAAGDPGGWQALVQQHHARLRRMAALRLDPRLQGRVDPSDVLQEAYLDAAAGLRDYLAEPVLPVFLWLRLLVGGRLLKAHRHHLGTQQRDAAREVSLHRGPMPGASSAALAAQLLGREGPPSEQAARAELRLSLQEALNQLDELDREALALRHFEQLTSAEAALVLGITESGARQRYLRALARLKDVLAALPGGLEGFRP